MKKNKEIVVKEIKEALAAQGINVSLKDVSAILTAEQDVIATTLKEGGEVNYVNFGKFDSYERAERPGTNPQTKQPITIAAARVPRFKAGKGLKDQVDA